MKALVTIAAGAAARSRSVAQQHADQAFPHVLVNSTAGATLALASIWLTALAFA